VGGEQKKLPAKETIKKTKVAEMEKTKEDPEQDEAQKKQESQRGTDLLGGQAFDRTKSNHKKKTGG